MKRALQVLPVVAAATLLLGACGSSDPEPTPASAPTESSAPASSAPSSVSASSGPSNVGVYNLPGTGVFPEGITAADDTFYVTSTSDGAVFRGTVGSPDVSVFLPGGADGRTGAAGIDVTDDDDRPDYLVIAGGATGKVWVYDANSGDLVATFTNGLGTDATFLNDVAIADNGDAFVTDSRSPALYRIPFDQIVAGTQDAPMETFVNFDGSPFVYGEGFNANGIVENDDESALIVVQSSTGNLYRIDKTSKEVTQVDLGGATLMNGDGMEMDDDTLYVVRNRDGLISKVDLNDDGRRGSVTGEITDPSFAYPTTVAAVDDRLLVVNSQFDKRGGEPVEPFTVSSVPQ
ncbi:superoxide dismutase [Rhodococcus sp. 05-2256-B2]|uniref:SMP-30/gluconolactonase/LRE family protein n=1 Tax=unclassified Rhodococcus (in: high G+C Gram-positive bacteria) TaxID=192944 RepID=UPI000B9BE415|nr:MULTISPECIES: superoxide dismutase [unclassified Rhodococcus (in: high G+C Gram-positive bacteria)]MBY4382528.1 superoxide dismutase [Rhodococcus fascians]MBY4397203.1 superoxide dismutase [Rhodococcus fascians]MBY4406023.1 superoxide dismutase [Rhodococcus fascians]MBY4422056.1 superoxide dismutase [Rhodococcus fascians]MBY4461551.1 superoxide dismutase [Rhodococcus fascians]